MSVSPLPIARVTNQMQSSYLLGSLQNNQAAMLKLQEQISSGQQLSSASDDPVAATGIINLNTQISGLTQYGSNLNFAAGFLNTAGSALGSVNNLLNQAQSIASTEASSTASASDRSAQASILNSIISQVQNLANTQYLGQSVFGGQNTAQAAYTDAAGGYLYQGTSTAQGILTPNGQTLAYTVDGSQVFGGVSAPVAGSPLQPAISNSTLLSSLGGTSGTGIHLGTITATDGTNSVSIDLSKAATVGDVLNTVNSALASVGIAGSMTANADHFTLFAGTSTPLTISDANGGSTAANLGIAATVPAGTNQGEASLQPAITPLTTLGQLNLGAGISYAGIQISNGTTSATIPVNANMTIQGLINAINGSGTFAHAQINAAHNGINVYNSVSGTNLTIGENGGTTAGDLGIRSFSPSSVLSAFNGGTGVATSTTPGPTGNITVTNTSGTSFNVAMNGITTPTQLIAAINSAPGNSTVTAALNPTGNGITLTDSSGGSGNLSAQPAANYVSNGTNLGFLTTGSGATLTGTNMTFSTDDFVVTRRDGGSFSVSLAGAKTVQDVLNAINNAAGNTSPGTKVTASLNPTGNGIQLSDASTGSGVLSVASVNNSQAAAQLGLPPSAAAGTPGVINGTDTNPVAATGVFSSLIALRNALLNNDTAGITAAGTALTAASQNVINAQGVVGARAQDVSNRQTENTADQTNLQQALSLLSGTDMASAISQFSTLQLAYQATLQVAQTTTGQTLLDFLK